MDRLPDFVVIGAMKAGTTSAAQWLQHHPDVWLPAGAKEPHFFSDDKRWGEGTAAYLRLFQPAPRNKKTGEFSVSYTAPGAAEKSCARMKGLLPDARLVYLVRDPVARLRSHYQHEVLRGRERRPLAEALADPCAPYIGQSEYAQRVAPYRDAFGDQLQVIATERLNSDGWEALLRHLGLTPVERGSEANRTAGKPHFSRSMLWLFEHRATPVLEHAPAPLRHLGRRLLLREDPARTAMLADSDRCSMPDEVLDRLAADRQRLHDDLGQDPWSPDASSAVV